VDVKMETVGFGLVLIKEKNSETNRHKLKTERLILIEDLKSNPLHDAA
jgi:hypothetical protein